MAWAGIGMPRCGGGRSLPALTNGNITNGPQREVTRPRVPHSRARIRGRDAARRRATFDGRRGFQPIRLGGAMTRE